LNGLASLLKRDLVYLGLLSCIIFAVYLNSLTGEFVFDDWPLIKENTIIHSLSNWKAILLQGYRPVRTMVFAIIYHFFQLTPEAYHIINVSIHIATTALVYFLMIMLTHQRRVAVLGSLIFGLHPIQTDSVAYISGMKDTLCGLFYVSSFLAFMHYRASGKWYWLLSSLVSYAMAVFSKEMGVTLIAVFLVYDFMIRSENLMTAEIRSSRNLLWFTIKDVLDRGKIFYALFGAGVFAVVYYYIFVKQSSGFVTAEQIRWYGSSWVLNYLTVPKIIIYYLKQLFFPAHLLADYKLFPIVAESAAELAAWGSVILLGIIMGFAFYAWKQDKIIAFSILWFLITLTPAINLLPHHELMAEHYLYIPMVGFALFLSRCFDLVWGRCQGSRKEIWVALLFALLITGYAARTAIRNNDWKDDLSVVTSQLKTHPQSYRSISELGYLYINMNLLESAETVLQDVLRKLPKYAPAINNLGVVYQKLGEQEKAKEILIPARFVLKDGFTLPNTNLGMVYLVLGDVEDAISTFEESIRYNYADESAFLALGRIYLAKEEYEKAEEHVRGDLHHRPKSIEALKVLAEIYEKRFQFDKALDTYEIILDIEPNHQEHRIKVNLLKEYYEKWKRANELKAMQTVSDEWLILMSELYTSTDQLKKARSLLEDGLRHHPKNPEILISYAEVLLKDGNRDKAMEMAIQAIRLDKNDPAAHFLLSKLYATQLKFQQAEKEAQTVLGLQGEHPNLKELMSLIEVNEKRYRTLLKLDQNETERKNLILGDIYESFGFLDESLRYYKSVLGSPKLGLKLEAMYRIADNHLKRSDPIAMREAINTLNEIIKIKPDEADAYKSLGFIYFFRVEDYERAYRYLQESLRLNPNQPGAEKLSKVTAALGQYIQAVLVDHIYLMPHVLRRHDFEGLVKTGGYSTNVLMGL
jgi:tetratricopeptide (TPR) repeat protein